MLDPNRHVAKISNVILKCIDSTHLAKSITLKEISVIYVTILIVISLLQSKKPASNSLFIQFFSQEIDDHLASVDLI
jgi:hypothetical protein